MIWLDSARIVIAVIGFWLTGAYLRVRWPEATGDRHERARIICCTGALFVLACSRLTSLGDEFRWQLPAAYVIFGAMWYGLMSKATIRRRK